MTQEDLESAIIAFFLLGGMFLVTISSFVLIGFWWSVLWVGLLMAYVGIRLL